MDVRELHDVLTARLDDIKDTLVQQNGRIRVVEVDLAKHKLVDAYRTGLIVGGIAVVTFVWDAVRRKIGW